METYSQEINLVEIMQIIMVAYLSNFAKTKFGNKENLKTGNKKDLVPFSEFLS